MYSLGGGCSEGVLQIFGSTRVVEISINYQGGFVEKALLHGCCLVGSLYVCGAYSLENTSGGLLLSTYTFAYDQGSFIYEMELEPYKCLFGNTCCKVHSFCYYRCLHVIYVLLWKYVKLRQRQQMPKTYNKINIDFLWR